MSDLSRRLLVTGAAALPVLAVPAIAGATPSRLDDRAAIVARAEEVLDVLSTRFIRDGWHDSFDKDRAASFLHAIRHMDLQAEEVDHHERQVQDWIIDHGQSFEWIFLGYPSGMICFSAGTPSWHAGLPSSNQPDPIFAALTKHREAYNGTVSQAIDDLAEVEVRTNFSLDHPECHEADRKVAAAWDVEGEAFDDLLGTAPTTAAGAKAALDWFQTLIEGGDRRLYERTLQIYETLSTAIAPA
jgi:hypothetical protein